MAGAGGHAVAHDGIQYIIALLLYPYSLYTP